MHKFPLTLALTGLALCAVAAITPPAAGDDDDPTIVLETPVCCLQGGVVLFTYLDDTGSIVPMTQPQCVVVERGLFIVGDYRPTDDRSPCLDLPGCYD